MRLVDLQAEFVRLTNPPGDDGRFHVVEPIRKAHGVMFLCPKCYAANGGPRGTHRVLCWAPGVPQTVHPTPGRWNLAGTGIDDLTLVGITSSSVLLKSGCRWHGMVENGGTRDC